MKNRANPSDELFARIEAYYDGELSESEVEQLRAQLRAQPELMAAAADYEAIHRYGLHVGASEREERAALRRRIHAIAAEEATPKPLARRRLARLSAIAATFLLLVAAGYWYIQSANRNPRLAEEYFVWLPREEAMLGPIDDAARGLAAYDRQEYETAYPLLLSGVANGVLDSVNLLYAGVAALGSNRPLDARRHLSELLATGRYPLEAPDLHFYLGLAALYLDEKDEARRELAAARGTSSRNAERAEQLLSRLSAT